MVVKLGDYLDLRGTIVICHFKCYNEREMDTLIVNVLTYGCPTFKNSQKKLNIKVSPIYYNIIKNDMEYSYGKF
jgi:hypothetical protein